MVPRYEPRRLEAKWQEIWQAQQLYNTFEDPARPKYYVLEMFPYPSGRIHMGHVRNYTIGDVVARYKRMRGFNVLHPMGWDAFGLPAENAAMARGLHPAKWTYDNIAYMRGQLKALGYSYDWRRELATCDPDYYRWEQLVFIEMYRRGLAYKKEAPVNWCPKCATVLANEQVEDGLCWRCDSPVHLKELDQWFFKITAYAEELLADLELLTDWPERVLTMQRNWIGKSQGAEILFPLAEGGEAIKVFTTRADTLFGATFMSLAPEHPLALELAQGHRPGSRSAPLRGILVGPEPHPGRPGGDHQGGGLHRALLPEPGHRLADAHLRGQLRPHGLRHRRGDGGAGPRPAGFRVRPEIRPAHQGGDSAAGRRVAGRQP